MTQIESIAFVFAAVIALITTGVILARGDLSKRSSRWALANSLVILAGWSAILLVFIRPSLLPFAPTAWWGITPAAIVFTGLLVFLFLERSALQVAKPTWILWTTWLIWVGASLLLNPNLFGTQKILRRIFVQEFVSLLPHIVLFSGWWILLTLAAVDIAQINRQPPNPLIRKRAQLWIFPWVLLTPGQFLLLQGSLGWGMLFCILAVSGAAWIALARDLPYPRYLGREVLSYLILTVPVFALTWGGLELALKLAPVIPGTSTLIIGAAFALLWIGTFRTSVSLAPRLVNRIIPATRYDTARLLREYSLNVSNTTAPNMLASVSINLLCQAIDLKYAHLFEVLPEAKPDKNCYLIRDTGGRGENGVSALTIYSESLFAKTFRSSRKPLFVNQINTNPFIRDATPDEVEWFTNPRIEVFVPINTKSEWVGLFALGQKSTGAPYSDDDLTLINALADQISLAMQNARLVDSLMRVNNDFRRAYAAMEQSNQQLQQAFRQLEKIDRTKSDFISVSSHELRTPMTVIRGYNEMLLDDNTIKANPYHHKLVKGIQSGMERMQEVVESMLDVASIDSSSLQLHKETISLNFAVHSVVDGLQKALAERNIALKVENLRDLPSIEADRENMEKVFLHLLTNAIKYTPDGGSVTVSAVVLAEGKYGFKEGGVEVIVSDTGIGIAPENLELVFKKFYQTGPINLHSSGKVKFKGAGPGLGLAIAKGIVEAHGGKIWAESAGHDEQTCPGSQFHVALPLRTLERG
jgi:signal transduction histidine kinase